MLEGFLIERLHVTRGGAVDKHGDAQALEPREDLAQRLAVVFDATRRIIEHMLELFCRQTARIEHDRATIRDADHAQRHVVLVEQDLALLLDLLDELCTDDAAPHQEEVDLLVREVERGVNRANGDLGVLAIDHTRDRARALALSDRQHVDADAIERVEEAPGDAGCLAHMFCDKREQGHVGGDPERLDLGALELDLELLTDGEARLVELCHRDDDRDGLTMRGLRGHPDGDLAAPERGEDTLPHEHLLLELAPTHIEDREVLERGHAHRPLPHHQVRGGDARPRIIRDGGVSNPHRDTGLDQRQHRARVEHLGAVVRELERLEVGQVRDRVRIGDDVRVGSHHARDIGANHDLFGLQCAREQCRGVITAVSTEGRRDTILGLTEETCTNGHGALAPVCAQRLEALL